MICEACGKRDAALKVSEQKPPNRILILCKPCYESGKEMAFKGWKVEETTSQ